MQALLFGWGGGKGRKEGSKEEKRKGGGFFLKGLVLFFWGAEGVAFRRKGEQKE